MRHENRVIAPTRRVLLWVALISGFLLLSFAAALHAGAEGLPGSATRRQEFNASGTLRSLSVDALNGSVEVVAGPAFAATVDLTARARTDREARRILDETQCRFVNEDGELTLVTEPPGVRVRRTKEGGLSVRARETDGFRVEARYRITLPAAVALDASVVSGPVSVRGIAADLKLSTVNGKIEVSGARKGLKVNTVNGSVDVAFAVLPKGAEVELKAVNGNLLLKLPSAAAFTFHGRTMSGEIVSTFPFPARGRAGETPEPEGVRVDRERIVVEKAKVVAEKETVRRSAGDALPAAELADLERSMAEMSRELAHMGAEMARVTVLDLNRSYEGTVGGGGALVRMSNLSGRIAVLAEGTAESQAKPLLAARHAKIVEVTPAPRMARASSVPAPHLAMPVPPEPPEPPEPPDFGRPVVRGDVAGDFVATDVQGDVRLGRVSGKVKVTTQWGEIRVASAGKGAELSTAGGEISIDAVTGDLTTTTMGGEIRAGSVSGDARLSTSGGDIVVKAAGGSVTARTSAGDITLRRVRGPVVAETSGGTVVCEIVSVEKPGVEVATGGGDVTLILPANYRGDLDIRVTGVDAEGDYILSQFPEIAVVKREGTQRAEGKLGGGGPKITVRTAAGVVRIRKGPAAP
jgi:DUF4097 and DUF4098 domain-containing protein YvlB